MTGKKVEIYYHEIFQYLSIHSILYERLHWTAFGSFKFTYYLSSNPQHLLIKETVLKMTELLYQLKSH